MKFTWLLVILTSLLLSCSSINNVKESRWKYVEGYHIGDLLDFNREDQFKIIDNGNIYIRNELKCKVIKHTKRKLIIEGNDGQLGMYTFFDKTN